MKSAARRTQRRSRAGQQRHQAHSNSRSSLYDRAYSTQYPKHNEHIYYLPPDCPKNKFIPCKVHHTLPAHPQEKKKEYQAGYPPRLVPCTIYISCIISAAAILATCTITITVYVIACVTHFIYISFASTLLASGFFALSCGAFVCMFLRALTLKFPWTLVVSSV